MRRAKKQKKPERKVLESLDCWDYGKEEAIERRKKRRMILLMVVY